MIDGTLENQFMGVDEFTRDILAKVRPQDEFQPQVVYDKDGDCLEFLISNDNYKTVNVDHFVTIYVNRENDEIVGSLLRGIKKFVRQLFENSPGFMLEFEDGKVRLDYLFNAHMWGIRQDPDGQIAITYRKLRDTAEAMNARADLCELMPV